MALHYCSVDCMAGIGVGTDGGGGGGRFVAHPLFVKILAKMFCLQTQTFTWQTINHDKGARICIERV